MPENSDRNGFFRRYVVRWIFPGLIVMFASGHSNVVWAGPTDFFKPQHVSGASSTAEDSAIPEATPTKKKKSSYSFAKYKRFSKELCNALRLDGRQVKMFEMLDAHDVRDPECPACKPLISSISSSCRPPKPPKVALHASPTPEATSEPKSNADDAEKPEDSAHSAKSKDDKVGDKKEIFLQREPSVAAVQAVSQIFSGIAEDEEWIDENFKAVDRLSKIFREKSGKTQGELEYFDILTQYMLSPFSEYLEKKYPKGVKSSGTGPKPTPAQSVGSLFE